MCFASAATDALVPYVSLSLQRFAVLAGLGLASAVSAFAPAPVATPRLRGMLHPLTTLGAFC